MLKLSPLDYSFKLLSYRPHSELELKQKLQKKEYDEKEIRKTIFRLKELKYLDDKDFAKRYIQNRINLRPQGKYFLIQELKQKGIQKNLVEEILETLNFDELKIAKIVAEKKEKNLKNLPEFKKRQKLMMYLQSKGFSLDVVYEVCK